MFPDSTILPLFAQLGSYIYLNPGTGEGYYKYSYLSPTDNNIIYSDYYEWYILNLSTGENHDVDFGVIYTHSDLYQYNKTTKTVSWFGYETKGDMINIVTSYDSDARVQRLLIASGASTISDPDVPGSFTSKALNSIVYYLRDYILSVPAAIVEVNEGTSFVYQSQTFQCDGLTTTSNIPNDLQNYSIYSLAFSTASDQYLKPYQDSSGETEVGYDINPVTYTSYSTYSVNVGFEIELSSAENALEGYSYLNIDYENGVYTYTLN